MEPAPPAPAPVQVSARRKRLALVGFRPGSGAKATQVFIRTNEPVHYTVSEDGEILRVVVENTRVIRRNDLRTLDTHFFVTPVNSIQARQVKGDVVVEIRLKSKAPYRAVQNGDEVQVDFEPARAAELALPVPEHTAG
jgi:colicin import membrane protein